MSPHIASPRAAPRRRLVTVALLLALTVGAPAAAREAAPGHPAWIWWEAEAPRSTNFPDTNPFVPEPQTIQALSGGRWIGANEPGKILFLEYDVVTVAKGSTYQFFARKFWRHGPFRWRFDDQPWQECGRDVPLLDSVELAKFVSTSWVHLGAAKLPAGKHVLRVELLDTMGGAAFDCFLLTTEPFVARGKLKPDEKSDGAPPGWFVFEPDHDPFAPAALDLRWMNELHAGDGGFIQVKGDGFVHGATGKAVRFWAINVGHEILGYASIDFDRMARFLAKKGVNMVRLHGPLWKDAGGDITRVDQTKLAHIHDLVRALKQEGIYLALSSYFPVWLHPTDRPPFDGFDGHQPPFGVAFFNDRLQQIQKDWWRATLTAVNPHTGLSLVQDPTLAFIEIVNEDSLFFWTFVPYRSVPAPQMQLLETRFGGWLQKRSGLARTLVRWGGPKVRGDDIDAGRVGVLPIAELVDRRDARARDTVEFLADVQRTYFDEMIRYLKHDLAFKGSVVGSNWITADARTLGPLDKWSNTGGDFMDRHGYFCGPHEGERAAFAISDGDRYDDALAPRFEGIKPGVPSFELPIMDLAYNGKPSTVSEMAWVPPNRYRTDMPALAAAYGALQGTDAFFFFIGGDLGWSQRLDKFTIDNPAAMGQFPAAALMYRKGLIATGPQVVRVVIDRRDLIAMRGLPFATPQNVDQLRMSGPPPTGSGQPPRPVAVDPLAFLVGRVEVDVDGRGATSTSADLAKLIDRTGKVARSATGELSWDWGRGLVTIDAPAAQGATGLLAQAGAMELGDVTISSHNEYGAVLLVAIDDRPLATSRKMLLQVMSEDANRGWSAPGRGIRPIVHVGGPPLVVKNLAGRVTFKLKSPATLKVRALDANGYPTGAVALSATHALDLLPTTLYYLIER